MNAHGLRPIAVAEKTAAAMLDLSVADFANLVANGALPGPKDIGGHKRWMMADLEAILTGDAAKPKEAFSIVA